MLIDSGLDFPAVAARLAAVRGRDSFPVALPLAPSALVGGAVSAFSSILGSSEVIVR